MNRVFGKGLGLTQVATALALFLAALSAPLAATGVNEAHNAAAATQLAAYRSELRSHFAAAYRRYPDLPRGVLEALAFVQSRWMPLIPEAQAHAHQFRPQAWGAMGLTDGSASSTDLIGAAAQTLKVSRDAVQRDAATNILGAAALLNAALRDAGLVRPSIEDLSAPLARVSGLALEKHGAVSDFVQASFAYDVLLALDRGHDDHGIRVPERAVRWERAFAPDVLVALKAPFVRVDLSKDTVEAGGYAVDNFSEQLIDTLPGPTAFDKSTDYAPALWVASPYHSTRSAAASAVTIHTVQGTYAGCIGWFQNNPYSVSAHYVVRSSDGQVTQMVSESRAAHHVGSHNGYTLGIEHEGYVDNAAWYTTAMYNASSALTRHFCTRYAIDCTTAYNGPSSSGLVLLPTTTRIKGHQHYSSQTHTDPGINWDWPRYYALLNPNPAPTSRTLDSFEAGEGHFATSPSYSGSTVGIATSSTAERDSKNTHSGSYAELITLYDDPSTSAAWAVRFLSGVGSVANNESLQKAGGRIGLWVYASGRSTTGIQLSVDDSDGSERSIEKFVAPNVWTYVEWKLDDQAEWDAWVNGDGIISAANITLDAVWFSRSKVPTTTPVHILIDDVGYRYEG